MSSNPTLLLVDGSSYIYRAFHAMQASDLRAVPGDPTSQATGALRVMINMMQSLRKDMPADFAACVFDAKGPTFRDALYPQYKAHRPPMPDDLRSQIEPIHQVVRLLGWTVLNVPGVEADDVIGTLAVLAAGQGMTVVVSSGDKDLSQLVTPQITIVDTLNGKRRDVAGVRAEFGVPPERMIDFQTLVGDAVDNVPGVHKVGPKTAAKWLHEFGSLDQLMARADEVKGVAGDHLRQALSWLPTGRQLVTIKTDCDLHAHVPGLPLLDALQLKAADADALRPFYEQYGFKGLARALTEGDAPTATSKATPTARSRATADLFAPPPPAPPLPEPVLANYDCVLDWASFDRWLDKLQHASCVAFDTETTSLDAMRAELVGLSFCIAPGQACYLPLGHVGPGAPTQLPREAVLEKLRPWFENPQALKLGQHIKYDRHVLANQGVTVRGYAHDTLLQSYVLGARTAQSGQFGLTAPGAQRAELRGTVWQRRASNQLQSSRRGACLHLCLRRR